MEETQADPVTERAQGIDPEAPFGRKKDGTPKKKPGRQTPPERPMEGTSEASTTLDEVNEALNEPEPVRVDPPPAQPPGQKIEMDAGEIIAKTVKAAIEASKPVRKSKAFSRRKWPADMPTPETLNIRELAVQKAARRGHVLGEWRRPIYSKQVFPALPLNPEDYATRCVQCNAPAMASWVPPGYQYMDCPPDAKVIHLRGEGISHNCGEMRANRRWISLKSRLGTRGV